MQLAINAKPMAIFCAVRLKSKPTRASQDLKKAARVPQNVWCAELQAI